MNDSRHLSVLLTWHSRRKNIAGDWRNDGRGVRAWGVRVGSSPAKELRRSGSGVDGKKLRREMPPTAGGVLAAGEAKESERALRGEMRAGPRGVT